MTTGGLGRDVVAPSDTALVALQPALCRATKTHLAPYSTSGVHSHIVSLNSIWLLAENEEFSHA